MDVPESCRTVASGRQRGDGLWYTYLLCPRTSPAPRRASTETSAGWSSAEAVDCYTVEPFKKEPAMEFEHSEKVRTLQARVEGFMAEHIYPNEEELFAQINEGDRWQPVALLEELRAKARAAGLWNLFLPE